MRVTKVTKREVDSARPAEAKWTVWDGALPGFGVVVHPSGRKAYVLDYRTDAGRRRRLALGRHGELTPEQARRLAAARLAEVRAGGDPLEAKREARREAEAAKGRTVEALAEAWLQAMEARAAKGQVRERTVSEYRRQVEKELGPRFGDRPLAELTAADLRALHDSLAKRPVLANRVVSLVSQLWGWAAREGYIAGENPARGVEPYAEKRREEHFTREELARLGAALRTLEAEEKVSRRTGALVRLVAYTGCRPGEVKRLAWDAVDRERRVLRVRGGKTGDRSVWLSGPALEVLAGLRRIRRSPWVFPSPRDPAKPIGEVRKAWARVLDKAKLPHVAPYALRHTFASESEAAGNSLLVTAALLGHAAGRVGGMTGGYVHHLPDDVRRASEAVATRIQEALGEGGA